VTATPTGGGDGDGDEVPPEPAVLWVMEEIVFYDGYAGTRSA
jgi:hypothetical protein